MMGVLPQVLSDNLVDVICLDELVGLEPLELDLGKGVLVLPLVALPLGVLPQQPGLRLEPGSIFFRKCEEKKEFISENSSINGCLF